jgi:hypothetical protein
VLAGTIEEAQPVSVINATTPAKEPAATISFATISFRFIITVLS